jgi:hypothetical protein
MHIYNLKRIFTILAVAFIALISADAKAQDTKTLSSYFGFFGGLSIPQGDFAKSDYYNNKAGFAKKGLNYGLDGAYYFHKNWAIGISATYQDNGELTFADVTKLAQGYTSSFTSDNSSVTATGRYQSVNLLLGPQYSVPFGKFILDLRASAGVMKFYSTPNTQVAVVGVTDQTKDFFQRGASPTVFAYGANAALRFHLSDNVFLTLHGAYINSQGLNIKTDDRTTNIGRLVTKQPITELQTTIGLSFGL